MWKNNNENFQSMGFSTPPPPSSKLRSCRSPVRVMSERKRSPSNNCEVFHIIHKVPAGDSPYVKAKQVQVGFWVFWHFGVFLVWSALMGSVFLSVSSVGFTFAPFI